MYIDESRLTILSQKYITVNSDYDNIVYAIDRSNKTMWVLDRLTGQSIEVDAENTYKFADEMMSVAEIFLGVRSWEKAV